MRRTLSLTISLACLTLLAVCCGCQSDSAATSGNGNQKVTLQLNWRADAQHGGFYAALAGGDYAKEGLDVEIIQGGPGSPVLPKLVMSRVDFAIANADQILQAREQDADIVGIFAPLQHSPRCIMVRADAGIESLSDLKDITLGMNEGRTFAIFLKSKLSLEGVKIVPYDGSISKFVNEEKFAQQGYVFSEPLVAKRAGVEPKALMVSELGFDPYSSVLVARNASCDEQPELVNKFLRATRLGWERYLADPTAANKAINTVNPDMDLESLTTAAAAIQPLCKCDGDLGSMTSERWHSLTKQMKAVGAITTDPVSAADKAWR